MCIVGWIMLSLLGKRMFLDREIILIGNFLDLRIITRLLLHCKWSSHLKRED